VQLSSVTVQLSSVLKCVFFNCLSNALKDVRYRAAYAIPAWYERRLHWALQKDIARGHDVFGKKLNGLFFLMNIKAKLIDSRIIAIGFNII